MDDDTMKELRTMLATHAHVVRCMATLMKMNVANDNARAKGKDDRYDAASFADVEHELREYAQELSC